MCFTKIILKGSERLEAKIATRPIIVLKLGRPIPIQNIGFESLIYSKLYTLGKLCTQKSIKFEIGPRLAGICGYSHLSIERGFYSYRNLNIQIATQLDWSTHIFPSAIGIFEIPKGAIYYSTGNIFVSDSIKLLKVIDSIEEWKEENFKPELIL